MSVPLSLVLMGNVKTGLPNLPAYVIKDMKVCFVISKLMSVSVMIRAFMVPVQVKPNMTHNKACFLNFSTIIKFYARLHLNTCLNLTDKVADYNCKCEDGWGGKNCSVELTGCLESQCLHGGTCIPWCSGECGVEEQHFNCTCPNGYHGNKCQSQTTFSLYGDSYIKIPSNRLVSLLI